MPHLIPPATRFTFLVVVFASWIACTSVKQPVASSSTTGGAAATATPAPTPQPAPTPEAAGAPAQGSVVGSGQKNPESGGNPLAPTRGPDSTVGPNASESADQGDGATPEANDAGRAGPTSAPAGVGLPLLSIPPTAASKPPGPADSMKPPAGVQPPSGGGGAGAGGAGGEPAIGTTPHVRMVPSLSVVTVGSRLSLRVQIEGASDAGSVPFHVVYNPAVLKFEGGREGPFLGGGGRQTAFFAAPMSSGNEMVVGLSRLGAGNGIGGNGELCTLDFTVVGPGNAGLAFARAHVRDSANRIVPAVFDPASVTAR